MTYQNILVDGIMHLGDMIMTASVFPVLQKTVQVQKSRIWLLVTWLLLPSFLMVWMR